MKSEAFFIGFSEKKKKQMQATLNTKCQETNMKETQAGFPGVSQDEGDEEKFV